MVRMLIADKKAYSALATYLDEQLPRVADAGKIWTAFLNWSGLSEHEAKKSLLEVDEAPLLRIGDLTDQTGTVNGEFRFKHPNWIFLDQAVASHFEQNPQDERDQTLVQATLLHELVHWGNHQKRISHFDTGERGRAFEAQAYGRQIHRHWEREMADQDRPHVDNNVKIY